ncbi:hypothetical protein [Trinickia sp.]|uniref:hypothetical protein n=1 Tax=Trinickia sp. TaxID=2571163 RepID=UPI003F8222C2
MKPAIHAAGVLMCSIGMALALASPPRAQPARAPPVRSPEMSADWQAPPANAPAGASAPRGNLRGDIESNARWNDNGTRNRPPPKH